MGLQLPSLLFFYLWQEAPETGWVPDCTKHLLECLLFNNSPQPSARRADRAMAGPPSTGLPLSSLDGLVLLERLCGLPKQAWWVPQPSP